MLHGLLSSGRTNARTLEFRMGNVFTPGEFMVPAEKMRNIFMCLRTCVLHVYITSVYWFMYDSGEGCVKQDRTKTLISALPVYPVFMLLSVNRHSLQALSFTSFGRATNAETRLMAHVNKDSFNYWDRQLHKR